MSNIYEEVLTAQQLIDECFDSDTGEILEEQEQEAIRLHDEVLQQGLETLCKVRVNYNSDIEALKNEEKRLAEKRKRLESKVKGLEKYIQDVFVLGGKEKEKAGIFTISWRKSKSVELADNFENADFGVYEFKADKTKIKEAIKQGQEIDGAILVEKLNLQIK